MSEAKALSAVRDLYQVQQEIKTATKQISDALDRCSRRVSGIRVESLSSIVEAVASNQEPHLIDAYQTWVSDEDSYFTEKRRNSDGEITGLLSEGGDLECLHCLKAHQLVLHRKALKKKRGSIRRTITIIGKSAAKEELK